MEQKDNALARARYKILATYHRPVRDVLIDVYNRRGNLRETAAELGISLATCWRLFQFERLTTTHIGRVIESEPDPAA